MAAADRAPDSAPPAHDGGSASEPFESLLVSYGNRLAEVLTERRWAVWARRDPELQKILARLLAATHDLLRCARADEPCHSSPAVRLREMTGCDRRRVEQLLATEPASLTLDLAIEVIDALHRILADIGDARYVCEEIRGEIQWSSGSTTWMTWDEMFGAGVPTALETYERGEPVPPAQLAAGARQLASLYRARSEAYLVHRARLKMRASNLRLLAAVLLPVVLGVGLLMAQQGVGAESARGIALVGFAGALGAVVSGTIRARDRSARGSDLRAFRAGFFAQVLVGVGSAFFLLLVLTSGLVDVVGAGSLEGQAAIGFVAGFSEPFVFRTVERVASMGEDRSEGRPATDEGARRAEHER